MSLKKSDEFKRKAVQLALTSGLSRKQVSADLGIGLSTLNRWVSQHKHDDLMPGPHDDLHKELARLRKENRILKEEREILKKGDGLIVPACWGLCKPKAMRFKLIDAKKADHPLHVLCKAFNVSLSGYYDWRKRPMSQRQRDDLVLLTNIRTIHKETYQSYGREGMTDELRDLGFIVSEKRVARLMKGNNIKAIRTHAFKKTTDSDHNFNVAPNLLNSDFTTTGPNQKCAGDISYIKTAEGWLYLAVVIDLYSRRVIGWATSKRLKRKLVIDALQRAIALRQPPEGVIFRSDRGSQYCSHDYQKLLRKYDFKASMSCKGNCYDCEYAIAA